MALNYKMSGDASGLNKALDSAIDKLKQLKDEAVRLKDAEAKTQSQMDALGKETSENAAEFQRLRQQLESLKKEEQNLASSVDKATSEIKEETSALGQNITKTKEAGAAAEQVGQQLKSTFTMVKGLIIGYAGKTLFDALIGSNAQFESSVTQFEVLLGSAEKANAMVDKLYDLGAKTPFSFNDLAKAEQLLLNYGLSADEAYDSMKMLGDIAQGDAEKLQSVALAYGQMSSLGKVQLQDLKQMIGAGFNPLQIIAEKTGESMESLYDRISKGTLSIKEITNAMQTATSEGGRYYQSMEKQSQTWGGMISTLQDDLEQLGRKVGEEAFGELKDVLSEVLDMIENIDDDTVKELGSSIASVVRATIDLIKWLYEMKDLLIAAGGAWAGYKAAMMLSSVISAAVSGFNTLRGVLTGVETSTKAATAANETLKASQLSTPWGIILATVGAVVGGIIAFSSAISDSKSELEKFNEELNEVDKEYKSQIESIKAAKTEHLAEAEVIKQLYDRYEKLTSKTKLNRAEKEELRGVCAKLNSKINGLNASIDDSTKKIKENSKAIKENIKQLKEQAIAAAYADKAKAAANAYIEYKEKYDKADKKLRDFKISNPTPSAFDQKSLEAYGQTLARLTQKRNKAKELMDKAEEKLASYTKKSSLNPVLGGSSGGGYSDGGKSGSTGSDYEARRKQLEKQYKLGELSEKQYLKKVLNLSKKIKGAKSDEYADAYKKYHDYLNKHKKESDKDEKYQLKVAALRRKLLVKGTSYQKQYYKDMRALAKQYYGKNSEAYKDANANLKKYLNDQEAARKQLVKQQRQKANNEIKTLKSQLENDQINIKKFETKANKILSTYLKNDTKYYKARLEELKKYIANKKKLKKAEAEQAELDRQREEREQNFEANQTAYENALSRLETIAERAKDAVDAYYDEIEKREDELERKDRLTELERQEQAYINAATEEGQAKLREIREEIKDLKRDIERDEREAQHDAELGSIDAWLNSASGAAWQQFRNNSYIDPVFFEGMVSNLVGSFSNAVDRVVNNYNQQTNNNSSNYLTINQNIKDTTSAKIFAQVLASGSWNFINV